MAPPTQGTPVTLRIPPDVLAAVDRRAKREHCTRAELLRRIISEAVKGATASVTVTPSPLTASVEISPSAVDERTER